MTSRSCPEALQPAHTPRASCESCVLCVWRDGLQNDLSPRPSETVLDVILKTILEPKFRRKLTASERLHDCLHGKPNISREVNATCDRERVEPKDPSLSGRRPCFRVPAPVSSSSVVACEALHLFQPRFCFVLFFICGLAIILLFRFKISETMRKNNTCHVPHTQYVPNATGGPWYPLTHPDSAALL